MQAVHTVVGDIHHIADLSETLSEVLGQLDFIFNEQNFHEVILEECDLFADYEFVIWLLASCCGPISKVPSVSKGIAAGRSPTAYLNQGTKP